MEFKFSDFECHVQATDATYDELLNKVMRWGTSRVVSGRISAFG